MKKSNFVALTMGTCSGMLFALGMCMVLLPEWNAFREGVVFGIAGLLLGIITLCVWCKMEHKKMPKPNGKAVFFSLFGVIAALIFGIGMCMCLVRQQFLWGTIVGFLGIIMSFALIPMVKGLK